ncbi:hypothetical protein C4578_02520 [Candidatus Microgenomates bacterium]|jgi:hypothetical protein|nr:MAG: hypothetical protein C4578_02520 [Candidatus Microgenomates bacterium]
MKRSLLLILVAVFLLVIIYILINLSSGRTNFFGKASGSGVLSPGNSYVFASPITAKANLDKIRVTVFALDGQGKGIANALVSVGCKESAACNGVSFTDIQQQTDTLGQAIFDVSSSMTGKYEIQAYASGTPIPQTVTVNFQ